MTEVFHSDSLIWAQRANYRIEEKNTEALVLKVFNKIYIIPFYPKIDTVKCKIKALQWLFAFWLKCTAELKHVERVF